MPHLGIKRIMVMSDPTTTNVSDGEAASGLGLFLLLFAVIALAIGLAGLTLGHAAFAAFGGTIAVIGFVGSMACFVADTRRYELRG